MAWCRLLLKMLILASLLMDGVKAYKVEYKEINPVNIRLRIKEESDIINVTWKNPNRKINDECYESNLQYKSQCDLDWRVGSCFEASTNLHIVIIVIPVIFFLVCLFTQKQIRRFLLPKVPDPKHVSEDLLEIDQSQLERTFKDRCVECVTLKIEITHPENEEEEEEVEQSQLPAEAGDAELTALTRDTAAREPTCASNSPAHTLEGNGYIYW